jgi:hypothetical protein
VARLDEKIDPSVNGVPKQPYEPSRAALDMSAATTAPFDRRIGRPDEVAVVIHPEALQTVSCPRSGSLHPVDPRPDGRIVQFDLSEWCVTSFAPHMARPRFHDHSFGTPRAL